MSKKKKVSKLSEKQSQFIRMFMQDVEIEDILEYLDVDENTITNWLSTNSLMMSSLASAIYIKRLSLYIRQLNLRIRSLQLLDAYVESGDLNAVQTILLNSEEYPDFNRDSFNSLKIKKSSTNDFLRFVEDDLNIPGRFRKDFFNDDDNNAPPF
tara:strand:- start:467 stop:928 length:462 start_codon:yes stop_codon:yes gene_type:complete